jgi:hypothetical protein
LMPFFECYNWGCECCTSVFMTLWPTHTLSLRYMTSQQNIQSPPS